MISIDFSKMIKSWKAEESRRKRLLYCPKTGSSAGLSQRGRPLSPCAFVAGLPSVMRFTCRHIPNAISFSTRKRRQAVELLHQPCSASWKMKAVYLVAITVCIASGWIVYPWHSLLDPEWRGLWGLYRVVDWKRDSKASKVGLDIYP